MKLLVGLGNPGKEYTQTRHNVGFMVIERLAREWGVSARHEPKFQAVVGEAKLGSEKVILAQPVTYMNLSGESVQKLMSWYKLTPADVLVVYDDFALPLGALRVRPDGSAGGHNGISSLIRHLGTQKFDRVRVGIGPVPPGWKTADFVLGRFSGAEQATLTQALDLAAEASVCVLRHGVDKAMADYNGLKPAL